MEMEGFISNSVAVHAVVPARVSWVCPHSFSLGKGALSQQNGPRDNLEC